MTSKSDVSSFCQSFIRFVICCILVTLIEIFGKRLIFPCNFKFCSSREKSVIQSVTNIALLVFQFTPLMSVSCDLQFELYDWLSQVLGLSETNMWLNRRIPLPYNFFYHHWLNLSILPHQKSLKIFDVTFASSKRPLPSPKKFSCIMLLV